MNSFVLPPRSASCGGALSLSISVLPVLCCCSCMFGSSPFSLKSSFWLSFLLGCSACFLCSSLVSARVFPDLVDLATDSYIAILSSSCSFSLKPPTFSVGYFSCLWLRIQSLTPDFRGVSVSFFLLSLSMLPPGDPYGTGRNQDQRHK